ncbi:MAG: hypothetical protein U5J83_09180 [Bryobacterales bacterium]|nr:hypothetical protein [Bryobacterales bacterium]
MRGIASLVCTFCFLFWGFSPNAQCRFRVVVEIPDASESYVAMLKDTWASYLGHRRVPVRGKAKFEDVPAGDFSLRIHFASGAEIVKSLRVDDAHTTSKDKLALRLRAADAVITPESRQAMHTVSVDELAVSTKAQSLFNEAWQAMERSEWQQARRLLEESA